MKPKRRSTFRIFLTSVLGLVALIALLLGFLATSPGHAVLARLIERLASSDDLALSIDSLSGWPPFHVGAGRVALADRNGVFATVDDMQVDVHVSALFAGLARAESFAASHITVARMPVFAERGDTASDGALLPLPVDRVSIERLDLGAELVGTPVSLTVAGALTTQSDGGLAANLDGSRIDGHTGTFTARLERADGAAPLIAHVEATEAADGLLAGIIGRTGVPAYRLTADSDLVDGVWRGNLSLDSEGDARFAGTFSVSGEEGASRRLVLSGEGDLDSLAPPAYANLLAGPIVLDIDADWNAAAAPALVIRKGTVTTAALTASAAGAFGGAATNLDLSLALADPAGAPITVPGADAMRIGGLTLNGGARATNGVTRLELTGRASGLAVGTTLIPGLGLSLALEADGNDPLADREWPFGLRLEADAIETPDGRLVASDEQPITVGAEGTLDPQARTAAFAGEAVLAGSRADLTGNVSADEASADIDATIADIDALAPLLGNAATSAVRRLGGAEMRVTGTVSTGFQGRFSLSDLNSQAAQTRLSGDLELTPDSIEGAFSGEISDLSQLAAQSSGAASFTAEISGSPARPNLEATVKMAEGRLFDRQVENASIALSGAPSDTGWRGALTLDGAFAGKPLAGGAEADYDRASSVLSVPDIDLAIGDNRITGTLTRGNNGLFDGALDIDAPDIQSLAALALTEASGRAEAHIRLSPANNSQSAEMRFFASDLSVATANIGSLIGEAAVTDAFAAPLIRGTGDAANISIGNVRLDTANLAATVEGETTRFQWEMDGPDIDLTGSGNLSNGTVTIERVAGTAYRVPIETAEPVRLAFADGGTQLAGAALSIGGGRVSASGTVSPRLDLAVDFNNIAASLANTFAPTLGAEGTLSGRATITGTTAAPDINWNADWNGLGVAATRSAGLPALALSARGAATTTRTTIDATLSGAGLSLALAGQVPFSGNGLNLTARGTAPLALAALTMERETRLAGTATLDLTVSGAPAAPSASGTINLSEAMLADPQTGFGIAGASGRIRLDGNTARVENFNGRLTQGGQIAVSGSVGIAPGSNFPADLAIRITDGRYSDGSMVNAAFSSQLSLTGPLLADGTISGRVDLGRTEILLPDRLGGAATAIEVEHVNPQPGFASPLPARPSSESRASGGGDSGLRLALDVVSNSAILVRGFGLDAELGGSVRLTGTLTDPQSVGAFDLVRGRIEVIGRRFDFTDGRMVFSGDLIPILDFNAAATVTGATVTVNVAGPANEPVISFSSSSGLPEEEVLARLLFDRGVGQLSALQAVQLIDAVAQLSGAVGRGGGLFDRIRRATGLDDLDIRQNEAGDTTVGIGRRINENIRLGVEQDTGTGGGRVTVDLDVTRNVKVRGETGQDGSGKVGITFEREY